MKGFLWNSNKQHEKVAKHIADHMKTLTPGTPSHSAWNKVYIQTSPLYSDKHGKGTAPLIGKKWRRVPEQHLNDIKNMIDNKQAPTKHDFARWGIE